MSTAVNAVIAYLVTAFDGGLDAGVSVYDGPVVTQEDDDEIVYVGYDATEPDELADVTEIEQPWAQLGALRKGEVGTVTCAVLVRSGDGDIAACRLRAYELLGLLEDILRLDPSLGAAVIFAGLSQHRLAQAVTSSGARARVTFTIQYKARI